MVDGQRVMAGPLGPYSVGYAAELARMGYAKSSTRRLLALMGKFSCWMEKDGVEVGDLTGDVVEGFLGTLREADGCRPTARTLDSLLCYLRDAGVAPCPVQMAADTLTEQLLARFRCYLLTERGFARGSVDYYIDAARLFLSDPGVAARAGGAGWTAADVTGFAIRHCPVRGVGSAKNLLTGLRSFLRFAHLEALTPRPLVHAVPPAAGWSDRPLPTALRPGQAGLLLASCDQRRETGRRDYAILVVLIRLGLRAGETAALTLDDVNWRSGEITIRGKGNRTQQLPLPGDVGAAIAAYLRHARPDTEERAVFLRAHAPRRALSSSGVSEVVRAAGERAGLPGLGAHRLRHTAATELLRAGASLAEVAQILRHDKAATTALYAKVDQDTLRPLARPWPGTPR